MGKLKKESNKAVFSIPYALQSRDIYVLRKEIHAPLAKDSLDGLDSLYSEIREDPKLSEYACYINLLGKVMCPEFTGQRISLFGCLLEIRIFGTPDISLDA